MVKMYTIKKKPEDFKVWEVSTAAASGRGQYVFAVLKKKDYTTLDALKVLARFLNLKLKHFGFAGTKDRKAVAEQMISVRIPAPGMIQRLQKFSHSLISICIVGKSDRPISLGDLEGNRFEILVRDADSEPKKPCRFANYFGEQRFSRNNAAAGKLLVQGKLDEAVSLMDEPEINESLSKEPSNVVAALKMLPKKALMMYVHSYQSLLWNKAADEYINRYSNGRDPGRAEKVKIPLIGFGTELEDYSEEIQNICRSILQKEGITERDFINRKIKELSSEGGERMLFAEVRDLRITKRGKGTYMLEFFLPKGCYATELVKQMFA